ncbi:hypothetical protein OBBRIDRAFT_807868 [Obba rivulosa]|uniref:Uncharacterized protein n=1 Tax=Obba rivulosa TaxID=1052685 RepID=A0A8E2ANC3_9APHY|nr:hypothetical protein OBBRIDRAFT_807868 [Obba rivulosa]
MPSLTTVVSAIVGGCILVTLLLSYAIWSICCDQAEIQRQRRSSFGAQSEEGSKGEPYLHYTYPGLWRIGGMPAVCVSPHSFTSLIPQLKPSHPQTPPPLFETWPLSDEIRIAFLPGFSEDALNLSSQDLADVRISEELKMAELAEEVARESGARREPGAGSSPL